MTENTIVIFLSDHGEYGAAHGGMVEKWHTAYEEILHVPFMLSSPLINPVEEVRYVDQLTSHIDVLPTLLGLIGIDGAQQNELGNSIEGHTYLPLPGANLAPVIADPTQPVITSNGKQRRSVLFMTDDTITQYLQGEEAPSAYQIFLAEVEHLREQGIALHPGSVTEPCHIRCARTEDWKLARYFDHLGRVNDQWELYYLKEDRDEAINLVNWDDAGNPVLCPDRIPSDWPLTPTQLQEALATMRGLLVELEEQYLGGPRPYEEPYTLEVLP